MNNSHDLIVQNQLLNQEIKRRIDQISAINTVAAAVAQSLDLNVTLDTALQAVVSVVGTEAAGISLIDEEAGEVVLRAQYGWTFDFVQRNPMRIPLGKGMSGQVINNDDVLVYNNLSGDETYAVPGFTKEDFKAMAMAPMHAGGRIIGILSIMSHQPDSFDEALISVLRAIADTVGVAIENARLYEQHVEQENRLSAILHSTADGIIATDQTSRIRLVNDAAAQMLEVQPDRLLGIPLREASINNRVRSKLLNVLADPDDHDAPHKTDSFRVVLEEGREFHVLVSPVQIASQITGSGTMDGWVIVLQDITHIREAEIARVQFMQAAAHDMKNPLSVTLSSLHMLQNITDEQDCDDEADEIIDIARNALQRLQRLIDDLLQIEKIESGYGFLLTSVDIRELCYEIGAQIATMMENENIDFNVHIDDDIPVEADMDRNWIQRALHNFLENAIKYSSSVEHPAITLRVTTGEDTDTIHFEVVDNGPGIPPRARARLFDRFFRVHENARVRGSGLGLTIVKSVAEAHQGSAYIHSQEGSGSTFGIAIPVKQDGHHAP